MRGHLHMPLTILPLPGLTVLTLFSISCVVFSPHPRATPEIANQGLFLPGLSPVIGRRRQFFPPPSTQI